MLKQRVITALVLLAVLLPALFSSNTLIFSCIVLAMMTAGAWEWGRLNKLSQLASIATAGLMFVAGIATWQLGGLAHSFQLLWTVTGAFWVLGSALLIKTGVGAWGKIPLPLRWFGGLFALWAAGLAMVQARQIGVNFLLSILALVWVADVFAYFTGRAFGLRFTKVKLAPAISPGKSWEGAWGGACGVVVVAFVWVWMDWLQFALIPSFYSRIFQQGWWILLIAALFMAAMSVIGDLVESLIKRSAGAKDSSQLLPGHGGILDRIDALLPTLPLAMMLTSMVQ
ncbi:MAG: phosphatidate cytidylyltransferase [Comamonas sp.]|nr:phosphatidate cytidylyltransferase [Comamonas sp.]